MSDHDPQPAGSPRDAAGRPEGDQTLARLLQQRSDPTSDRAKLLLLLERAARAVAEVHERGQVLPGLSPASLRVDAAGRVAVNATPVPIPRTLSDAEGNPADGLDPAFGEAVARAAPYVSPEVARLDATRIDERADVFALGSALCEILTGAPAYVGNTPEKVRLRAAKGDLAETFARLDGCGAGEEVVALTRSCLSTSLAVRPRTAGDLAERLSAAFAVRLSRLSMAEALLRQETERASAAEALAQKRRGLGWKGVAALLFFMLLVAAGAAAAAGWAVHWRQTRLGAVDLAVNEAILRSTFGSAAGEGSAAQFEAAKTAVTRVGKGLDRVPYSSKARAQLADAATKVDNLAAAALADRALVERVELARGGAESAAEANRAYREAFLTAGIDLEKAEPDAAEIGRVLLSRPAAVALTAAQGMDFWSMVPSPETGKPDPAARTKRLAVARVADPDPWRNRIRDAVQADDKTACRRLWLEREFQLQGPETHNLYARALLSLGETALALDVLQAVVNRNPGDYWANATLAEVFLISMRQNEKKSSPGAAPAAPANPAQDLGRRAEPYARAALAAKPTFVPAQLRLTSVLTAQGRIDEGIALLSESARARPENARVLHDLGQLLFLRGQTNDALAVFARAARANPGDARNLSGVGLALLNAGRYDEALAAMSQAAKLDPKSSGNQANLGAVLLIMSRFEEAAKAYQEAVRLDPKLVVARINLGIVLEALEKTDEAVATLRKAIETEPDAPLPHKILGEVLSHEGKYDEAIAEFDEALKRNPSYPEVTQIRAATERLKGLAPRLPAVLNGTDTSKDAAERLDLARICYARGYYATAAKMFEEVLSADPKKAEDLTAANRYQAARAAVRAGCGLGREQPAPADSELARWRSRALDWLRADLTLRSLQSRSNQPGARTEAFRSLLIWKGDPSLAGVREPEKLARIPESERRGWEKFWSEVDALVNRPRAG